MVDQILDVVEEAVTARQKSTRKGLLGSAVVGKRVTDLLDLNEVIHAASESWFQGAGGSGGGKTVLVAEGSPFSRGLLSSGLDMAGYRVKEAANLDEAMREMEQQPADVVVAAHGPAAQGRLRLCVAAMRATAGVGADSGPGFGRFGRASSSVRGRTAGFEDCQAKFDGDAVLESVARLASAQAASEKTEPISAGEEK